MAEEFIMAQDVSSIKTEPENTFDDNIDREYKMDERQIKLEPEELYENHEVAENIVIGPTVLNRPVAELNHHNYEEISKEESDSEVTFIENGNNDLINSDDDDTLFISTFISDSATVKKHFVAEAKKKEVFATTDQKIINISEGKPVAGETKLTKKVKNVVKYKSDKCQRNRESKNKIQGNVSDKTLQQLTNLIQHKFREISAQNNKTNHQDSGSSRLKRKQAHPKIKQHKTHQSESGKTSVNESEITNREMKKQQCEPIGSNQTCVRVKGTKRSRHSEKKETASSNCEEDVCKPLSTIKLNKNNNSWTISETETKNQILKRKLKGMRLQNDTTKKCQRKLNSDKLEMLNNDEISAVTERQQNLLYSTKNSSSTSKLSTDINITQESTIIDQTKAKDNAIKRRHTKTQSVLKEEKVFNGSDIKGIYTTLSGSKLHKKNIKISPGNLINISDKKALLQTGKKTFSCDICGKGFGSNSSRSSHIETCHNVQVTFLCNICGRIFKQQGYLNRHILINHSAETYYFCNFCDEKIEHFNDFISHMSNFHNNNMKNKNLSPQFKHSCDICSKRFKTYTILDQHKRIHSGEKSFSCDVCNKSFRQLSGVLQHARIHDGAKPYSCDVCNKKFRQASNLVQHKRIHTGEKPFVCVICNKTFTQLSNVQQHIKNSHKTTS